MLKVSACYLEKQKSFIPKKKKLSLTAKIDPKDGVSCPNFQWMFWFPVSKKLWLISGASPVNQHPTPSATPVKPRLAKRADSQVPNLFAHPPAAEVKKIFIYLRKANVGD